MTKGGGLWEKEVSAKNYISFYLSVIMSLCLMSVHVCLSFDFVLFVSALSSRIDLVFTCSSRSVPLEG